MERCKSVQILQGFRSTTKKLFSCRNQLRHSRERARTSFENLLAAQKHQGVFAATTGERNDPKSRLAIPIFSAKSREVSQMFCSFLYNFGQFADLRCFSGISDFPQFRQISMKNLDEKSPNLTKIKQQVSYKFAYIRKKL